jgi:hypothetical protein
MANMYIDSGGNAAFSGTSDSNTADLTGASGTWSGTTTVTLDGSPDLAGISTSGTTQAAIYLTNATNSNKKIFWISAVDNDAKTITVDVAPTGTSGSVWNIGGRNSTTVPCCQVLRPGDTMTINNNLTGNYLVTSCTLFTSGTSAGGPITIKGKAGVRPKLTQTDNNNVLYGNTCKNIRFENLEIAQQGVSGAAVNMSQGMVLYNVKVSDSGGYGISLGDFCSVINCEVSGTGDDAIHGVNLRAFIYGCYIHDGTNDGIDWNANGYDVVILNNIIDTMTANGILIGATTLSGDTIVIVGNTVYGCGANGISVTDADTPLQLINNIFLDNGDAGTEYNINWTADSTKVMQGHNNCFNADGARGGGNLNNYTAASTDITTAPAFADAPTGNFNLSSGSPCINTGTPIGLTT